MNRSKMNTGSGHTADLMRGVLLAAGGVVLLSPDALLIRLGGVDGLVVQFYRGLFSLLVSALVYAFLFRRNLLHEFLRLGKTGMLIALIAGAGSLCFIFANLLTDTANVLLILSISPVLTALFARVFLGEKIDIWLVVAAVLCFCGAGIIALPNVNQSRFFGEALAFACATCLSIQFVLTRKVRPQNIYSAVIAGYALAAALSAGINFSILFALAPINLWWLFVGGGLVVPLSFALLFLAPRYISATQANIIMLLESVLGSLWVWLVFAEQPSIYAFIGGAIILGAIAGHLAIVHYCNTCNKRIPLV